MLTRRHNSIPRVRTARQAGVVLVIALIVLVAMTLGAVALIRSVDTANLIAGNLAFQQSAIRSADAGFEAAITWLQDNKGKEVLEKGDDTNGYVADGAAESNNPGPTTSATWDEFWTKWLAQKAYPKGAGTVDQAGNSYHYVIHRMCASTGAQSSTACLDSPIVTSKPVNAEESGSIPLKGFSPTYYRITVRVDGPKNTVAYVQTVVSM